MLLDLPTFTLVHVVLSMVGIAAGLVVAGGLMAGKQFNGWIGLFLVTTILTNITGFFFPFSRLLPSHVVGGISLVILPITAFALYGKKLEGRWRQVFVITSILALYFNFFVLMVQLFQKMPALIVVAPNQSGPAFGITQLLILAIFIWIGRAANRGFRTA